MATAAALVAACGGGGDASPASSAPAGAPSPAPAAASTCGLADFAASLLARVNQVRAAGADCRSGGSFGPAAALSWNALLTQAADAHSQDMVAHNFFSHTGSDGSTLGSRVSATGYAWTNLGENIAAGQPSVNVVVDGWMASDGHCSNIMNPAFQEIGVACVPGTTSTAYGTYWTMDLARPR
jgi:uncharacterized protein YkwD